MQGLFKKFLTYLYGSGIGVVIGFVTTIVSARLFMPEDYGKASMYFLIINLFMILIFMGTDQAFIRYFYIFEEYNRIQLIKRLLKIPIVLFILVGLGFLIFLKEINLFLFGESTFEAYLLIMTGILFQIINRYILLIIRMQQKGLKYSILEVVLRLFNLLFIILLYFILGPSYMVLVYSILISTVITVIIGVILEGNFWKKERLKKTQFALTQKEILNFSFPFMVTIIITWLFESIDKIALRYWSDYTELGLYNAAFKIIALLNIFKATFSTFWTPVSYEKFEKNVERTFFVEVSEYLALSMFILSTYLIMFKDFIVILLGSNYTGANLIIPFLVFMPLMYTLSEVTVSGINFYKKTKWHLIIAIIICIANMIGNYMLVPKFGAMGSAISTGLAFVLFFILRTQISQRYYKVPYKIRKIYISVLLLFVYAVSSVQEYTNFYINICLGLIMNIIILLLYKNIILKLIGALKRRNR